MNGVWVITGIVFLPEGRYIEMASIGTAVFFLI